MKFARWWLLIVCLCLADLCGLGIALAFAAVARAGWSPLIGVSLVGYGAGLGVAFCALVYDHMMRVTIAAAKKINAEGAEEMAEEIPKIVMGILDDMKAQGVIPDNIKFSEIGMILRRGRKLN